MADEDDNSYKKKTSAGFGWHSGPSKQNSAHSSVPTNPTPKSLSNNPHQSEKNHSTSYYSQPRSSAPPIRNSSMNTPQKQARQ